MKKQALKHSFTLKMKTFYFLFLALIAIAGIYSCNSKDSETKPEANSVDTSGKQGGGPGITGISNMNCVMMTKADVQNFLNQNPARKKLIIKISSSDLTSSTPIFQVLAYAAKKHKDYGTDAGSPVYTLNNLPVPANCTAPLTFTAGTKYIFGNNEIHKNQIETLGKSGTTYYNLRFTPILSTNYPNHVSFKVERCDDNGKEFPGPGPMNFEETNPSPPAPPTEN